MLLVTATRLLKLRYTDSASEMTPATEGGMTRSAGLAVLTLGVAACGGGPKTQIDPNREVVGTRWNAIIATSPGLVGALQVKGTGWMAQKDRDSTQTRAYVAIENAVPGGEHPWHVHVGRCGNDRGIPGRPPGPGSQLGRVFHQHPRIRQQHEDHHRLRKPGAAQPLAAAAPCPSPAPWGRGHWVPL